MTLGTAHSDADGEGDSDVCLSDEEASEKGGDPATEDSEECSGASDEEESEANKMEHLMFSLTAFTASKQEPNVDQFFTTFVSGDLLVEGVRKVQQIGRAHV